MLVLIEFTLICFLPAAFVLFMCNIDQFQSLSLASLPQSLFSIFLFFLHLFFLSLSIFIISSEFQSVCVVSLLHSFLKNDLYFIVHRQTYYSQPMHPVYASLLGLFAGLFAATRSLTFFKRFDCIPPRDSVSTISNMLFLRIPLHLCFVSTVRLQACWASNAIATCSPLVWTGERRNFAEAHTNTEEESENEIFSE
jgi:hypothetical protein